MKNFIENNYETIALIFFIIATIISIGCVILNRYNYFSISTSLFCINISLLFNIIFGKENKKKCRHIWIAICPIHKSQCCDCPKEAICSKCGEKA